MELVIRSNNIKGGIAELEQNIYGDGEIGPEKGSPPPNHFPPMLADLERNLDVIGSTLNRILERL